MSNSNDEGMAPSRRAFTATLSATLGSALLASCGGSPPNSNVANTNSAPTNTENTNASDVERIRIAFRPIIIRNGSLTIGLFETFESFFQENLALKTATVSNANLRLRSVEILSKTEGISEVLDLPLNKQLTAKLWAGPADADPTGLPEIVLKTNGVGKALVFTFKGDLPSGYDPGALNHPKVNYSKTHKDPNLVVQQIEWAVTGSLAITAKLPRDTELEFQLVE